MAKGTKQVRVSNRTLRMVRIYAGELQIQTGDSVSDDKAIEQFFELYREDIAKRADDIEAKPEKGKK